MKLKSLINKPEINLEKGKFKYALIKEDEGVLVD